MKGIIIFLFIYFSNQVFGGLEVYIKEKYKLNLVDCEPIIVKVGWKNNGTEKIKVGAPNMILYSKSFYLTINGREYRGPWGKYKPQILVKPSEKDWLDPNEEVSNEIDLRVIGLGEGNYEIKAVVDFTGYGEGYYNGKVESKEVELEIRKPMGIDEEAYKGAEKYIKQHYKGEYKKSDFCEILTGEGWGNEFRNILLEKYPTSTYAGWVLAGTNYINYLKLIIEKLKSYLNGAYTDQILGTGELKFREKRAKQLEDYLNNVPNFVLADWMRFEIIYSYTYLGKYEEAEKRMKE